jgi:trimethylamine-N-oxide reductase cytochrome c-type subunit TorC|tara:strand:- start:6 stop:1007 length:1002 start_codon:yes stop_codon:yes gene_type:complete
METPFLEYEESAHFKSISGVRAECSSCHLPENLAPKLVAKVDALRHVYGHLVGSLSTDEKYEESRLRMAERVWRTMEGNDSRECRSCHREEAFSFAQFDNHSAGLRMSKGLAEGKTCIDCHKGLVHKMPDRSSGYKKLLEQLLAESMDPDIQADKVYPLETVYSYSNKHGEVESRILAATKLTILANAGDWLKVRVDGWQQQDVDAMIYELQGKRIFAVALEKQARQKPVVHSTMLDPDTEQTWHKVSYETWVMSRGMVEEEAKLWNYGEKLHSASCGQCHMAIPAKNYLANQWIGVMKDMKRNVRHLSKEQYRFLRKYLQLNAKDVKGDDHS